MLPEHITRGRRASAKIVNGPIEPIRERFVSQPPDNERLHRAILLLTATMLTFAATAKLYSEFAKLWTNPWRADSSYTIAATELEFGVAAWVFCGMRIRHAYRVLSVLFLILLIVSMIKAITGATTCGCFGSIELAPWRIATIDVAVLLALVFTWPRRLSDPTSKPPLLSASSALVALPLLHLCIGGITWHNKPVAPSTAMLPGAYVVLEPESWRGNICPLIGHTNVGDELRHGTWLVLLYRTRCSHCQRAISRLLTEHRSRIGTKVALIEVPPVEVRRSGYQDGDHGLLYGALSSAIHWYVSTPLLVRIDEGKVIDVQVQD